MRQAVAVTDEARALERVAEHASGLDVGGFADAAYLRTSAGRPMDLERIWLDLSSAFEAINLVRYRALEVVSQQRLAYAVAEITSTMAGLMERLPDGGRALADGVLRRSGGSCMGGAVGRGR